MDMLPAIYLVFSLMLLSCDISVTQVSILFLIMNINAVYDATQNVHNTCF